MPNHKQVQIVLWNGELIKVDSQLTEVITLMNMPGLATSNSCQGSINQKAYIQFNGPLASTFMHHLLHGLLENNFYGPTGIEFERWKDNGTWPNSYSLSWSFYNRKNILTLLLKTINDVRGVSREETPPSRVQMSR